MIPFAVGTVSLQASCNIINPLCMCKSSAFFPSSLQPKPPHCNAMQRGKKRTPLPLQLIIRPTQLQVQKNCKSDFRTTDTVLLLCSSFHLVLQHSSKTQSYENVSQSAINVKCISATMHNTCMHLLFSLPFPN